MRNRLVLVLLAVLGTLSAIATENCVFNASTKAQIVIPDPKDDKDGVQLQLRFLGVQVQKAFQETLGVSFPVVTESKKAPGRGIYLGATTAIRQQGVDASSFQNFDGIILERNGDILITGNDHHYRYKTDKLYKGSYDFVMGTFSAAIAFMEDYMQVRFFMPGDIGTDYLKLSQVTVPAGLTRKVVPRLVYGPGRGYDTMYNYANYTFGAGTFKTYGGHSYYDACPAAVYGKTHPEYFALKNGARNPNGNHLCISNPEVQELIYKEALKQLDNGAETTQVAQTDGFVACECEQCKAYGNTDDYGEKIWILHRSFAVRLLKDRPGKNLNIICYPPNFNPPKSFDSFPDNVYIELCKYTPQAFEDWQKIKVKKGFTTYIYNWGNYKNVGHTCKSTPEQIATQARLFVKHNVRGIYRCGFGELFGVEGPVYYVYTKMLTNPDQDYRQLVNEFIQRVYGPAAGPMSAFYDTLYKRVNQVFIYPAAGDLPGWVEANTNRLPGNPRVLLGAIYTPDILDTLENTLSRAESMANSPKLKKRLELVRFEFNYAKNLGIILNLYNAYRVSPTRANFEQLASKVEERNAMIASMFDEKDRFKPFPGWPEVRVFGNPSHSELLLNGRLAAPLASPFTWNIATLRKSGILPGTSHKKLTIKKLQGTPVADINAPAWATASSEEIAGIQLNDVWAKGQFKAAYDKENVYFVFSVDVNPEVEHTTAGHDGITWRQDALEILIDPEAQRQKYLHFMFNPVPNSYYEAAEGYITDPIHPLYGKPDVDWNAPWSYTGSVANGKWNALVTIPFKSLGIATPVPGSRWTMNIGREAFTLDPRKELTGPELCLWSPNMENMGFHEKEAFGDVVFE